MNLTTLKYLDHIVEHHNIEFACTILENYAIRYIKDFMSEKNDGENIPEFFGELAFLYSKNEIDILKIRGFMGKILNNSSRINIYLANHISNFAEIVLYYKSELINFYIERVKKIKCCLGMDELSILSSAVILPLVKNHRPIEEVLSKIICPWRSYFLLANYYLYYNENIAALNYVIKALKTCPAELKKEYAEREKYILSRVMQ